MKKLLYLLASVGVLFTACNEDDNFEKFDYSKEIVGTWTCISESYAEAMIINSDGTVISTGIENGEYWEDVRGIVEIKNNKIEMTFEDGDDFEGRFDLVPGETLSIVEEDTGKRYTYRYCKKDLSSDVVGMWVCNSGLLGEMGDMTIETFTNDGKAFFTGALIIEGADPFLNIETTYKVIGDLMFQKMPTNTTGNALDFYKTARLTYTHNATSLGDILTQKMYLLAEEGMVETTTSWIRVKESLDLAGNKYDYSFISVSNAKGEDKDIPFLNTSFNFAHMDGSIIDKFLKSTLFAVEFPDAKTLKYSFLAGGQSTPMTAPIEVEGNKMTIKMSANNPAFKDVVVYTFQDQDNSQMHMYMPTSSFETFFANTSVFVMLGNGQLDINDTEAIAGIFKNVADAIQSINVSIVMKTAK